MNKAEEALKIGLTSDEVCVIVTRAANEIKVLWGRGGFKDLLTKRKRDHLIAITMDDQDRDCHLRQTLDYIIPCANQRTQHQRRMPSFKHLGN